MARGHTFKKLVICHTNDFKGKVNESIKRWVESNGGHFSKELTPEVTHLIASKKSWKKYSPIVKQARRMRTVRIVKLDWLEMSLTTPPYKALPEDKWSYEQQKLKFVKRSKRKPKVVDEKDKGGATRKVSIPRDKRIETTGLEFDKACEEFREDMATAGFHPYSDRTGFTYVITLLRHDILKNRFEKYRLKSPAKGTIHQLYPSCHFSFAQILPYDLPTKLKRASRVHVAKPWAQCIQLYESDNIPHTYACYTQYTRPGVQKQVHVLAPPGSTWSFAWSMFQKFFARKAEMDWDARACIGTDINLDGFSKEDHDSSDTDREREPRVRSQTVPFQYLPPKLGEPDGIRGTSPEEPLATSQPPATQSSPSDSGMEDTAALGEQTCEDGDTTLQIGDNEHHRNIDADADADDEMTDDMGDEIGALDHANTV